MSSLYKNDIWELTELPKEKKAIGCNWVYVKKHGSLKDDIAHYKADWQLKIMRSEKILTTMRYSYPL